MKASRRKVEVIMLENVRDLRQHVIERVAPGEARNALVPRGQAVYAHYLNREKYKRQIEAARKTLTRATDGELAAERQRARDERLLKKLKTMRLTVDVLSDANEFLEAFTVEDVCKQILTTSNIVVVPEMIMLSQPFGAPGTYDVPLALLDARGEQVVLTLQLTPKQASTAQLKSLGLTAKGDDDDL